MINTPARQQAVSHIGADRIAAADRGWSNGRVRGGHLALLPFGTHIFAYKPPQELSSGVRDASQRLRTHMLFSTLFLYFVWRK